MIKKCSVCEKEKDTDDFSINNANKSGFQSYCRDCGRIKTAEARKKSPERFKLALKKYRDKKENKVKLKNYQLLFKYKLSYENFTEMLL